MKFPFLRFLDNRPKPDPERFHPFIFKHYYWVKSNFTKGPSSFDLGDVLLFTGSGYGPYDNAYIYNFIRSSDGVEISWSLGANESPDLWKDFFEEMPDSKP